MKRILFLLLIFGLGPSAFSQGDLKGTVKGTNGEPLAFATVAIFQGKTLVLGGSADFDGEYWIKGIPAGTYTIRFSFVGSGERNITGVQIQTGKVTFLDGVLSSAIILDGPEIVWTKPYIPPDGGGITRNFGRAELENMPYLHPLELIKLVPGSVEGPDGQVHNLGGRGGQLVVIDKVKMRGNTNIPNINRHAVEDVTVISGGTPAEYGDATGGIVEITTRSITDQFMGSVEVNTSKFLDNWDAFYFNGTAGGPMIWKKPDPKKDVRIPIMSFLVSMDGGYDGDPNPVRGGSWKVKDDVLQRLMDEPLQLAPSGQSGTRRSAEFLRMSDFERIGQRQNVAAMYYNVQAKFDMKLSKYTFFRFGGMGNLNSGMGGRDGFTYGNTLFNWQNNAHTESATWNVWGRFTHHFIPKPDTTNKKKRWIREAMVSVQVDYLQGLSRNEDATHGSRFFNYGHVGKFDVQRAPTYAYGYDPRENKSGWLFTGNKDVNVDFTPGTANPYSAAITSQYYTFFNTTEGNYDNFDNLQNRGALLNGQQPNSVYGLWNSIGTRYNNYALTNNNQFRMVFNGSLVVRDHDFQFGFEFEQRTDREYVLNPVGLWTLMRSGKGYTNSHLGTIDTANPMAVYRNGIYQDTINYPMLYILDTARTNNTGYTFGQGQTFFDWNLRQRLGMAPNSLDYIDVDALDPSAFSLDMFSPDELLNQGNAMARYYGYDIYGNLSDGGSFEDFFLEEDKYGNKTRPVAPFQPIYMAGYIMDKFSFKDIIFNVGVRIDYFDANQKMLVDKYSLYQTQTVGDLGGTNLTVEAHNAQKNWVVYVNDRNNPSQILGYRDGDTWYNAQGQEINDPSLLRTSSGRVQPLLADPSADVRSNPNSGLFNAFTDYRPQVNVLPRISFSFPIGDHTQFIAYYDVLTQRPSNAVRLNPLDYFFWDNTSYNSAGTFFNNPGLRPERTTDFAVGFRQTLGVSSGFKLTAFYREMRDYIALVKVNEAYPRTYGSWANIDFGTVKGLTAEYQLQKANFFLNASYSLMFADNTGSSNTSALNLVNSGQPNLRVTMPTNYDRRHSFTMFFGFNFGEEKKGNYLGLKSPRSGVFQAILQNLGFTATMRGGSGLPYSRQSNFVPTQTGGGQASLQGSINGARLPWQFNFDLQVYKDIFFKMKSKKNGDLEKPRVASVQIYLQVQNLFDLANITQVYSATGSPDDDGYLNAAQYQPFINSQVDPQSFRDLYTLSMNDPRNYSSPRRIRLGAVLSF